MSKATEQLRPYCHGCGWRKGGPDSWNGASCKCGHSAPPIELVASSNKTAPAPLER